MSISSRRYNRSQKSSVYMQGIYQFFSSNYHAHTPSITPVIEPLWWSRILYFHKILQSAGLYPFPSTSPNCISILIPR